MAPTLTEDDFYRSSTQYRLWSFSPAKLASLRSQTYDLARQRVRESIASSGTSNGGVPGPDFLSQEDELRLIQRYCTQISSTSDHFKFPATVKATAVQYLRRFYLSNSVLTYPPKEIYKTALFLACKTEATHMTLSEYARRIATEPDNILAPEYKLMQALRFTLDVRQPYKGLKGVLMEMLNMAAGMTGEVAGVETKGATELQNEMRELARPPGDARTAWKAPSSGTSDVKHVGARIEAAYSAARIILDGPALLTDAYFLYTPSQILLAALQIADPPLTAFYLSTKLPRASENSAKILATIHSCAELMAAFSESHVMSKDERAEMEDRLERCRDPTTKDLVEAHLAAKRGSDSDQEERARKKKDAREKAMREGDELFGPSLTGSNG